MKAIQHRNYIGYTPCLADRLADRYRPYTLIIDVPDYAFWVNAIKQTKFSELASLELEVYIGLSVVNPADQFNRKEGLKVATAAMKPVPVLLERIDIHKSGDIELRINVCDAVNPIKIILGNRAERALIVGDMGYRVISLHRSLYGGKP